MRFFYFVLRSHDTFYTYVGFESTIFWIIQVRKALFLSGDIDTWRHLYLDLLLKVFDRGIWNNNQYDVANLSTDRLYILYTRSRSQNVLLVLIFVCVNCVAMCQDDEFIVFILDVHRHSNVISARFKNKRGISCVCFI